MSELKAGILGFIGGFAGGKADQIDQQAADAKAEALRLRVEEAMIVKERRLAALKLEYDGYSADAALKRQRDLDVQQGTLLPDGSVNLEGINPLYHSAVVDAESGKKYRARTAEEAGALSTTLASEERSAARAKEAAGEQYHSVPQYGSLVQGKNMEKLQDDTGMIKGEARPTKYDKNIKDAEIRMTSLFPGKSDEDSHTAVSKATLQGVKNTASKAGLAFTAIIRDVTMKGIINEVSHLPDAEQKAFWEDPTSFDKMRTMIQQRRDDALAGAEQATAEMAALLKAQPALGSSRDALDNLAREMMVKPRIYTDKEGKEHEYTYTSYLEALGLDIAPITDMYMGSMKRSSPTAGVR